ncbi:hypothetical protein AUR66_18150, partial [Haloferax profundi]
MGESTTPAVEDNTAPEKTSDNRANTAAESTVDTDGDGLTDATERNIGTNRSLPDTDGDGLGDEREHREIGTDPTTVDTDGDRLDDAREVELGTDPTVTDTDSDGLIDGNETLTYRTDPLASDSDGDGLADAAEVREYQLSPIKADTDGDGLDDSTELEKPTSPHQYDTDADGLSDARELNDLQTNATLTDTDGDGLPDGVEVEQTDLFPEADPLHKDVYVEIDYMRGERVTTSELRSVEQSFANAPVENPDGQTGITLHLLLDERVPARASLPADSGELSSYHDYLRQYGDRRSKGYHYALIASEIEGRTSTGDERAGLGSPGEFRLEDTDNFASLFAHELGHSLGLTRFRGIDSEAIPYSEYPSVMNYNAPSHAVQYSAGGTSGSDQNDWAVVQRKMTKGLSTEKLNTVCIGVSFVGGDGSTDAPYQISTLRQLQCIQTDLDAHYELVSDIDATGRTDFKHPGH